MAKYYNTIKVKQRIPNFIEHSQDDLAESTVSSFEEIKNLDWVKRIIGTDTTAVINVEKVNQEYLDESTGATHFIMLSSDHFVSMCIGYIYG